MDQLSDSRLGAPRIANTTPQQTSAIVSKSATDRLVQVVLRASLQSVDFKNAQGLAKAGNVGFGTMRHWCRLARIPGRAFVRFARGFWATSHALRTQWTPIESVDCLEIESGSVLDPTLPAGTTIEKYCVGQTHLPTSHPVVKGCLTRSLLADSSVDVLGGLNGRTARRPAVPSS